MTYPDGTETQFGYDPDGNQVTAVGPAGTTHLRFDAGGAVSIQRPVTFRARAGR